MAQTLVIVIVLLLLVIVVVLLLLLLVIVVLLLLLVVVVVDADDDDGGGCLAALGTNTYSDTNLSSEENTNYFRSSYKNIYIQNTNTTNQSLF